MIESHSTCILISVFSIIELVASEKPTLCCGEESALLEYEESIKCENGQRMMLPCNISDINILNPGSIEFTYQPDDDGKTMYVDGFTIVHSPYYCVANRTYDYGKKLIHMSCIDKEIRRNHTGINETLLITIAALLFMISGIFLALTTVIYFFIPKTQDIEGRCTFHLTLNQSFCYLLGSYWALRLDTLEVTMMEEFCVGFWYLLIFAVESFFVWSSVLAFHMKRRFGRNLRIDESRLMRPYLIAGYGIPAVLVIASNIHVYIDSPPGGNAAYINNCNFHQNSIKFLLYAALPIVIALVTCTIFFLSLQRQLWSVQPSSSPGNSPSKLRKLKFRFCLNVKLFILTGLPTLLLIIAGFLNGSTEGINVFKYLAIGIFFFIACEGVVVFYILVIGRKRILQGIADKLGITVTGWRPCPESEESITYSNENIVTTKEASSQAAII